MNLKILDATVDDLEKINDLLRQSKSHWPAYEKSIDAFMDRFRLTPAYITKNTINLFHSEGELAGFFSFIVNDESNDELDYFFLHPRFIGNGFGRELWKICCQFALQKEIKEFYILSNPFAEGFYLKMGCKKVGSRNSVILPGEILPFLKFVL